MSGRSATTWPDDGSTKRMAAARPAPPSPSASVSSYSNAGVMTRANPHRSNTSSSVSAMRRRAAAARGAKSRMPVGKRRVGLLGIQFQLTSFGVRERSVASPRGARGTGVRERQRAGPRLTNRVLDDTVFEEADEDLGELDGH